MARRKIPVTDGLTALRAFQAGDQGSKATAVRFLLEELAERIPGNSVEVRVPPYMAVQCVPGPDHRRGTPPNVVELDAQTFIALATGGMALADAIAAGKLNTSGTRATEFAAVLPLIRD
ncbi:MAG: sterol carrier family protein [Micrococcales bacterium]